MDNKVQRYRVRDGYSFIYMPEVVDGEGNKYVFTKLDPASGGSVIEVVELQIRGQEHKLELSEEVTIRCNNAGCGKKFSTTATNATTHGWCPHCGGRGGTLLGATVDVKPDRSPEPEPTDDSNDDSNDDDTNRMEASDDNERKLEPEPGPEKVTAPIKTKTGPSPPKTIKTKKAKRRRK